MTADRDSRLLSGEQVEQLRACRETWGLSTPQVQRLFAHIDAQAERITQLEGEAGALDRLAAWCDDLDGDRYREAVIRTYYGDDRTPGGVGVRLYAQEPTKPGRVVGKAWAATAAEAASAAAASLDGAPRPSGTGDDQ